MLNWIFWNCLCIKMDLALNNLQWLICLKTKHNQPNILRCHMKKYFCMLISWPIVLESDLKVLISIPTTPRCRGGCYTFLWIAPLTLDLYLIILSVKQVGIKYHFFFFFFLSLWFGMTWPGIETLVSQTIGKYFNHCTNNKAELFGTGTLAQRLECSPMARETWVQSQVESYQRL